MFIEWASAGAEIGVKAFFAVVVFGLFCLAVIGLLAVLTRALSSEEGEDDLHRR